MTSIEPTSRAPDPYAPGLTSNVAYLSNEAVLYYCEHQLRILDGDVGKIIKKQQQNLATKQILADLESVMSQHNPPAKKSWPVIDAKFQETIGALPEGSEARRKIEHEYQRLLELVPPLESSGSFADSALQLIFQYPSKEEWAGYIGEIKQLGEDMRSRMELDMIELQSLLSQRQMAVQLTTNLLQKLSQAEEAVVKNI